MCAISIGVFSKMKTMKKRKHNDAEEHSPNALVQCLQAHIP
jgi:hypothetical protein